MGCLDGSEGSIAGILGLRGVVLLDDHECLSSLRL